jgi:tetraacyldisaccharide 4'-kinase
MLPAGRLREPPKNLKRADAIVITRSDLVDDVTSLRKQIAGLNPDARVFLAGAKLSNAEPTEAGAAAFAFCGVGNPESFFELLRRGGYNVKASRAFPDHHFYSQDEVTELERIGREHGAEVMLTTAKDMVKLENLRFDLPCRAIEIRTEIDDDEAFRRLVTSA